VFFFRLLAGKAGVQYPIDVATDGEHAVSYLERCAQGTAALPLVAFIDLKLPKLFGFEVLKWIAEQPALESMPRIVLTSSYEDRDVGQAYALGANGYLVKYPTCDDIAAVVHAAESGAAPHLLKLPGVRPPVER